MSLIDSKIWAIVSILFIYSLPCLAVDNKTNHSSEDVEKTFSCGHGEHLWLDGGGQDYRSSRLAGSVAARKEFIREFLSHTNRQQSLMWLLSQNLTDRERETAGKAIDDYLISSSDCGDDDLLDWIENFLGPDIIRVPVLVADFLDDPATVTAADIEAVIWGGADVTTLYDYYMDVSYGQLGVTGEVYGVFHDNHNIADYPADYYGAVQFVSNVVALADPYVDFSQYDYDGDGYVEGIIVVGSAYLVQDGFSAAHKGSISPYLTADGVYVSDYTYQKETAPIRVYSHEFGHILGLPDQYWREAETRTGIGDWCSMANGGCYLCAWCKQEMGWVVPREVSGWMNDVEIRNAEDYRDVLRLGSRFSDEYFLVENRQQVGMDSYLPGSGLLIWHVTDNEVLHLEEADGLNEIANQVNQGDAYDPFYFGGYTTEFTPDTNPNSDYTDGTDSGLEVVDISESGMTMTADLFNPGYYLGWSLLNGDTAEHLQDVHFVSESVGWAVGSNGTILHTEDGGETWSAQTSGTTNFLYGVFFLNAQTGYAVGANGAFLQTTDGLSWSSLSYGSDLFSKVVFIDASYGWVLSAAGYVLSTVDGGLTWTRNRVFDAEDEVCDLTDLSFVDASTGYISTDSDSLFFFTTDGGLTWDPGPEHFDPNPIRTLYAGTNGVWLLGDDGADCFFSDISFTNQLLFFNETDGTMEDVDMLGLMGLSVGGSRINFFDPTGTSCEFTNCVPGDWYGYLDTDFSLNGCDVITSNVAYAVGNDGVILKYAPDQVDDLYQSDFEATISDQDGMGYDLTTDEEGNIYVTGCFTGIRDFDPLGGSGSQLTSLGGRDGFIAKYDAVGDLVWAHRFGGLGDYDRGNSIVVDEQGNIYLVGQFSQLASFGFEPRRNYSSNGDLDFFVAKLNAGGKAQWFKTFGGSRTDIARGVAVDEAGDVYFSGYFGQTVDFDPSSATRHNLTSVGNTDAFIGKLNSAGSFVWVAQVAGTDIESSHGLALNGTNLYLSGYYKSSVCTFYDYSFNSTLYASRRGGEDAFVASYTTSGALNWIRTVGGLSDERAYDVTTDPAGNVYFVGAYARSASFGMITLTAGGSAAEAFVSKLNNRGNVLWAVSTKQSNGSALGRAVAFDEDRCRVYTTGRYQGQVDFDPSSQASWQYASSCGNDVCGNIFLWALDTDGALESVVEELIPSSGGDQLGCSVAVSSQGSICVSGYSSFNSFPSQSTENGGDVFILKD